MTVLSLQAAAEAVGCSRQHLYRLVGKGRVSAVLRDDGTKGIDTSELLRVFGNLRQPEPAQVTGDSRLGDTRRQQVTPEATPAQITVLEVELQAAKNALRVAEDRLREALERENRLLDLLASQTRLLEHSRSASAPPSPGAVSVEPTAPAPKPTGLRSSNFEIPAFTDLVARKRSN